MRRLLTVCMLAAAFLLTANAQKPQWPAADRQAKAGSRWWWMGSAVTEEDLAWQMQQLADAGIGTLEITPIYGVQGNSTANISFLSSKWLQMLDYTQQTGDRLGIGIDMTTGTGWPFGGPMVKTTESASRLVTETFDVSSNGTTPQSITLTTSGAELQRVMAFPQGSTAGSVTDLTALVSGKKIEWEAPAGSWKVIAAYNQYGIMNVKRPSPGSEGLVVDYFDANAVANYLKYFDKQFNAAGARWPQTFFNDSYEINQADWTPRMFEEFEKRRGYKLEENLDKLLSADAQVYADYRQTLADLLRDNFTRQWTEWAHSHGAATRNQAHGSPGNLLDLYAEADIPETENFYMNSFGIKGLRDDRGFYNTALSSRATLKYASSAAHVTGKPLTSSESMTWLTEHFRTSLSQIKPELDLLFTAGVNHVMFHGTCYSPKDAVWPGWKFYASVDMSPTNSIWADAPSMMRYIERVQSFMQMGNPDNDVLVYAPFAAAMRKTTGEYKNRLALFNINTLSAKMGETEQCANNLETIGLDCDYASEQQLMHTEFTEGKLQTAGGTRYKALVVPVTANMPDSVADHIARLRGQGCTVIEGYTTAALSALTDGSEPMRTDMKLSVIRRSNDTGYHYFVANLTGNDAEGYVALSVPFASTALFDPMTGAIANADVKDGKIWLSLKSGQSVIIQTFNSDVDADSTAEPIAEMEGIVLNGSWTLSLDDTHNYTLNALKPWEKLDSYASTFAGTGTYETTFKLSAAQMTAATAGFSIDLGDVRESARVYINNVYVGCAWAAPFVLNCGQALREGQNTLRIEVTNLPANKIRDMDRRGMVWRIFEDINMSTISSQEYASWATVTSGLASVVRLIPLSTAKDGLLTEPKGLVEHTADTFCRQYRLSITSGTAITDVTMTDDGGNSFSGFTADRQDDGSCLLTITGWLDGMAIVQATGADSRVRYALLPANGPYSLLRAYNFTDASALNNQWNKMKTKIAITGFDSNSKYEWYRSTSNATTNSDAFDGLTLRSEKTTYYCVFDGYGMNAFNDFTMTVDGAQKGDLCLLAYVNGSGATVYDAANSVTTAAEYSDGQQELTISMDGRSRGTIYRSATVYRPLQTATGINSQKAGKERMNAAPAVFNMQGVRVTAPQRGLYIRNGKKVLYR